MGDVDVGGGGVVSQGYFQKNKQTRVYASTTQLSPLMHSYKIISNLIHLLGQFPGPLDGLPPARMREKRMNG